LVHEAFGPVSNRTAVDLAIVAADHLSRASPLADRGVISTLNAFAFVSLRSPAKGSEWTGTRDVYRGNRTQFSRTVGASPPPSGERETRRRGGPCQNLFSFFFEGPSESERVIFRSDYAEFGSKGALGGGGESARGRCRRITAYLGGARLQVAAGHESRAFGGIEGGAARCTGRRVA
jgi:hypothetical protein